MQCLTGWEVQFAGGGVLQSSCQYRELTLDRSVPNCRNRETFVLGGQGNIKIPF